MNHEIPQLIFAVNLQIGSVTHTLRVGLECGLCGCDNCTRITYFETLLDAGMTVPCQRGRCGDLQCRTVELRFQNSVDVEIIDVKE